MHAVSLLPDSLLVARAARVQADVEPALYKSRRAALPVEMEDYQRRVRRLSGAEREQPAASASAASVA